MSELKTLADFNTTGLFICKWINFLSVIANTPEVDSII